MTSGVVCIDANFVVGLLIDDIPESHFERLWIQWQDLGATAVAPALIYNEACTELYNRLSAVQNSHSNL